MCSTGDALLAAIAAAPDEDTPRLAFADLLDERDDAPFAARAEFIRLQVALSRVTSENSDTLAARVRAAELREGHFEEWGFPPQGAAKPWYVVRRGFVGELVIDFPRVPRDAILAILRQEPVSRVRVSLPPAPVAPGAVDWLDVPALARVRHLELVGAYWSTRELKRVLTFRHFPALAGLALTRVPLTDAGVSAVIECERLHDLLSLHLVDVRHWSNDVRGWTSGLSAAAVQALASCPHLAGLRELSLLGSGLETAAALALAASPHLGGLSAVNSLTLADNVNIGPTGRARLVERFGDAVLLSPAART